MEMGFISKNVQRADSYHTHILIGGFATLATSKTEWSFAAWYMQGMTFDTDESSHGTPQRSGLFKGLSRK